MVFFKLTLYPPCFDFGEMTPLLTFSLDKINTGNIDFFSAKQDFVHDTRSFELCESDISSLRSLFHANDV